MPRVWTVRLLLIMGIVAAAVALYADATPFVWESRVDDSGGLALTLQVFPEAYVYGDALRFDLTSAVGAARLESAPPARRNAENEPIYPSGVWTWRFSGRPPYRGRVFFQGCQTAPDGVAFCRLPESWDLPETASSTDAASVSLPEYGRVERRLTGLVGVETFLGFLRGENTTDAAASYRGFWYVLLLAVLGGLALNLTPCVLPMLPVNLIIIGANSFSRRQGFCRGLAYGGGMALAYGALGLAVVWSGRGFGQLNGSFYFNCAIGAIFLLLAMAMAGIFQLDFSRLRSRLPVIRPGGRLAGLLLLGAVSALLAGACVAPVVIGVLLYAAQSYNTGQLSALFLPLALGIGMGLPWPLAGLGLAVLPRPGRFMAAVKYLFAALMLAISCRYFYLAYQLRPGQYDPERELSKLETAVRQARVERKLLLVDLWATWCANCQKMDAQVLSDPAVQAALRDYVVLKFQAEDLRDPQISELLRRWQVPGLPTFLVISPE